MEGAPFFAGHAFRCRVLRAGRTQFTRRRRRSPQNCSERNARACVPKYCNEHFIKSRLLVGDPDAIVRSYRRRDERSGPRCKIERGKGDAPFRIPIRPRRARAGWFHPTRENSHPENERRLVARKRPANGKTGACTRSRDTCAIHPLAGLRSGYSLRDGGCGLAAAKPPASLYSISGRLSA